MPRLRRLIPIAALGEIVENIGEGIPEGSPTFLCADIFG